MHHVHERFGKDLQRQFPRTDLSAVADSGCQTCTGGPDILSNLKCPTSYLVETKHCIVGITTSSYLDIIGALFLQMTIGKRSTKQIVYISRNCRGLYLSQTALRDLGLIPEGFPNSQSASLSVDDQCTCPARSNTPSRPARIPFPPTTDNLFKLKNWLLSSFASSSFNQCPHQPLPTMTGEPVKLHFKENVEPHAVHTPIPVPHHWKQHIKNDLDRDVRLGIIEPVPQGTTVEWCARMVVAPKKNGDPRRTVDLQKLNNATKRETHHTPSPFDVVSTVPNNTIKTVLDAWNGYHSIPLHDTTKEAMTFITEWGRYRYCRAPMGFHVSGDAYTRRFDDITAGYPRVTRIVDDSLLWDSDIESAFWHTFEYLKLGGDNGIVFNKDKFQFGQQVVEFAGFELTPEGYRPLKKILSAIENFPTPKSVTDVRSWFGLVNQLAYAFAQAPVMQPFRGLLSSKNFYWDDSLDRLFKASKAKIIELVHDGVKTFVPNLPTCLATDWSKVGIGFNLTQKHCRCPAPYNPNCGDDHWKLVFAGSRFTRGAESRYAPIEGEALAATYGLQRCRMFVMGAPNLILAVDHKPLTRIFNDRELSSIDNPRLLQLKEKTLMYRYNIMYAKGTSNIMKMADMTSRNPVPEPQQQQNDDQELAHIAFAQHQANNTNAIDWNLLRHHASGDSECVSLCKLIEAGFPSSKEEMPDHLKVYWPMQDDLYIIDNVPFRSRKMLIPKALRPIVLEGLHAAHQGVSSMLANARERFFWPGLDAAIRLYRSQCRQCNEQAPSQPGEPPEERSPSEYPFQQVAIDICHLSGFSYLIYVDDYSGWIEVANLTSSTFNALRKSFYMYFAIFGVPEQMGSDGGPPFDSHDYTAFLKQWNIRRRLSSAYYPQSNGRAEAGVKTAKRILLGNVNPVTGKLDNEAAVKALLTHRNTPSQQTGVSPACALFGRPLRDHLPLADLHLRREWTEIASKREEALAKRHVTYNLNEGNRLPPLHVGDSVQIQNQTGTRPTKWNHTGFVTEVLPHRQYRVVVDGSRRVTLRNRRFLKKILPFCRQGQDNSYEPPLVQGHTPVENNIEQLDTSTQRPAVPSSLTTEHRPNPNAESNDHEPNVNLPGSPPVEPPILRRSTRERRPPRPLSPKMRGQSHD